MFRKAYIEDIQSKIRKNARMEFRILWEEHKKTKTALSILSDQISGLINDINLKVQASPLFDNMQLRRRVMEEYIPASLVKQLGLETILARVPENYQRAMFSSLLASRYVYARGTSAEMNSESFEAFIKQWSGRAAQTNLFSQ
jgi:glutamate dehydrogenase